MNQLKNKATIVLIILLGIIAIRAFNQRVNIVIVLVGVAIGLGIYALQEFIRKEKEKKYERLCKRAFLDRVCGELVKEINWDSLYSYGEPKLLGLSTLTGKTLNDETVVIGALDNLDYLDEVLDSAKDTILRCKLTDNVPLWLYMPQSLEQDYRLNLAENSRIGSNVVVKILKDV